MSFNEEQIESSMRIISEEEEQWLMKPLRSKLMETGTENEETNLAEKQLLKRNATSLNQQLLSPVTTPGFMTPQFIESNQDQLEEFSETRLAPLDILDPVSTDLDMQHVINQPRVHKPTAKAQSYAAALIQANSEKIPQFYAAFSSGITKRRPHQDNLPPPPTSWHALLKHPHAEGFKQAAKLEHEALKTTNTVKVVPRPV